MHFSRSHSKVNSIVKKFFNQWWYWCLCIFILGVYFRLSQLPDFSLFIFHSLIFKCLGICFAHICVERLKQFNIHLNTQGNFIERKNPEIIAFAQNTHTANNNNGQVKKNEKKTFFRSFFFLRLVVIFVAYGGCMLCRDTYIAPSHFICFFFHFIRINGLLHRPLMYIC